MTRTHTLTLPLRRPPLTSNQERRAHWAVKASTKREVAQVVAYQAGRAGVPRPIGSCHVRITWFAPDRRRRDNDALNPFLKASLDALTACGVLRDDCPPHVLSTTLAVEVDRANPRIEITLTEEPT